MGRSLRLAEAQIKHNSWQGHFRHYMHDILVGYMDDFGNFILELPGHHVKRDESKYLQRTTGEKLKVE